MSSDFISFESMLAARESANWTYWIMVATWISLVTSLGTFFLAFLALNSWKQQEKTKVKMNFKKEILNLKNVITAVPRDFRFGVVRFIKIIDTIDDYSKDSEKLRMVLLGENIESSWRKTLDAWVMSESLLKETAVNDIWNELSEYFELFMLDQKSKEDILLVLSKIYHSKFIF